ncbi:MAG: antitoxin component YwqK of YwqJK toxin-antitoxin module [Saprospiraceae bacterium]|jgi:antitoxin component YwqK of YwqJK toxin-antitoxin module
MDSSRTIYTSVFAMLKFTRMRKVFSFIIILCFTALSSVGQTGPNVIDVANLKQGQWKLTGKDKNLSNYRPDQVVEEGFYKDGLKEGKWTKYYSNGRVEHTLTFKGNKLDGLATFYYKSGKKKEEGIWKKNRWVGDYKYFFKNGNLRNEWKYNETGKRSGVQKYYHENGKLKLEGAWENGKESGPLVEFYDDGSVKSERFFAGGRIDINKTKKYSKTEKLAGGSVGDSTTASKAITKRDTTKKDKKPFDGNGFNEFFNKDGLLIRKGIFKDGYLNNGEVYKYLSTGKLIKTYYYKGGKVVQVKNH